MIKTNVDTLVEMSVVGEITHPGAFEWGSMHAGYDGRPLVTVGMSGITYNVKVGDKASGWPAGDHVEPGASIKNSDSKANQGLNQLACVGNEAVVISAALEGHGKEKVVGAKGTVTGKHGGVDHVLVHFPRRTLDGLCVGDKIQVRAIGLGLAFPDYPTVNAMNLGPSLLKALNPADRRGKLRVPVAKIIPGKLMGSGLGSGNAHNGDYDIQTTSAEAVREYQLDTILLGDLVAISDHDCSYGPRWQEGAITIGVVVHGSSNYSGHGPGVVALLTSAGGAIDPVVTRKANLADLLKLA